MNGSTPRITKRTHYALGDRKIPTVHVVDEGATGVEFTEPRRRCALLRHRIKSPTPRLSAGFVAPHRGNPELGIQRVNKRAN